jgi:hypothetical protein
MLGTEKGGVMDDNEEAEKILGVIRDLAIGMYPFPKAVEIDDRYVYALAIIAGIATEALTAVEAGRPMHFHALRRQDGKDAAVD